MLISFVSAVLQSAVLVLAWQQLPHDGYHSNRLPLARRLRLPTPQAKAPPPSHPGQGDLLDGEDGERNLKVNALKNLFYSSSSDNSDTPEEEASGVANTPDILDDEASRLIGTMPDLAVCRWPWEILPHHQKVLVVHEPQYTHMFETILAGPSPHLYLHALLPGGTSQLSDPEFELRPGTKAPLHGTLMRIVAVLREADSRLVLVVQGLSRAGECRCLPVLPIAFYCHKCSPSAYLVASRTRAVVLCGTQSLPYARAHVQLLPDLEALRAGARESRAWLRQTGAMKHTDATMRRRLALAAATAEAGVWREYEFANVSVAADPTPKLCAVNASVLAESAASGAKAAVVQSMREMLKGRLRAVMRGLLETPADELLAAAKLAAAEGDAHEEEEEEEREEGEEEGEGESLYPAGVPMPACLELALAAVEVPHVAAEVALVKNDMSAVGTQLDEEEEAEDVSSVEQLEVQAWLELDALSRSMGYESVPADLLSLLPPPPVSGWPLEFCQERAAYRLGQRAELQALMQASGIFEIEEPLTPLPNVPLDGEAYPALRRAARLSFAIWAVIASDEDFGAVQPALEVVSIAERLRMALLRMRELSVGMSDDS